MSEGLAEDLASVSDLRELAKCALGLQDVELQAYIALLRRGRMTVKELTKVLGKSRPTVQRAVKNLVNRGLAVRKEGIISRGGYYYIYEAAPPEKVKMMIKAKLDEYY
ncbi:MAG: TrmB family transcriptional regulator, partial [Candidatus Altiarchaeales archaeon]